jgi:uncharacterized membrane protein YgcG
VKEGDILTIVKTLWATVTNVAQVCAVWDVIWDESTYLDEGMVVLGTHVTVFGVYHSGGGCGDVRGGGGGKGGGGVLLCEGL